MNIFITLSEYLSQLQQMNLITIIFRLALSLLLGGLLGTERGLRNRPAGFMTYVLVALGSTLFMLTNQYVSLLFPETDPTRLAAQVVSGIGFLGAGTIMVTRKDEIRGLTTAAGLWVAAGLGLAVGVGFYSGAIAGCAFSVFSLVGLKKIDIYIKQHARSMEIYLEYSSIFSLRKLSQFAENQGYELFAIQRGRVKTLKEELGTLVFSIDLAQKKNHQEVLESLYTIDGVEYTREIA